MMSKPQNDRPGPGPSLGFVVAMRAKLIGASRPPLDEWIIVSRWGAHGENLSIGWTSLPAADGDAPIGLVPCQTGFAVRRERSSLWTPATFRLAALLPDRIPVAGAFVPAQGYVRLYGTGSNLHLRSEGQCLQPGLRADWNLEATRAIWIGEFIEGRTMPPA
jgi:hypothetical protein